MTPSLRDIYWAAGYFEGEGCVRISGGKKVSNQTEVMNVSSTDKEPIVKLLHMFGGNMYGPRANGLRKDGLPKKSFYRWGVSGARARGVMQTLYALLSPRRQEQIKKTLHR
jgi:hypothetical protein